MPTLQKIYWFAYYNHDSPSVRYRAQYPLDFAQSGLGIKSTLVIPGYTLTRLLTFISAWFSALLSSSENSLVVIQRVRSNFIYANLLKLLVRLRKENTVYDLDDADYLEGDPKTIHFFAKKCKYVAAGSEEIVKYLRSYNSNTFHHTSPTPDLGIVKQKRNKVFNIGWVGSYGWGHKDTLQQLVFPAIKSLEFECSFTMVGVENKSDRNEIIAEFRGSQARPVFITDLNWHDEEEVQKTIATFDVGIATLMDHPLQLAKSGIKAKQYMNNGVPVLSTDLPENNRFVKHHYNGFLCNTIPEFRKRLKEFRKMDFEEYERFSENARTNAEEFGLKSYMNLLQDISLLNTSKHS